MEVMKMKKLNQTIRNNSLLSTFLMLAMGLIFLLDPKMSVKIICTIIAAGFLVFAFSRLFAYFSLKKAGEKSGLPVKINLAGAIVTAIISVIIFLNPQTLGAFIPIVIGTVIIVQGVIFIGCGVFWNSFLPKRGMASFIIGILNILLGFLAIRYNFATQLLLMRFIGIALVIAAVTNIANGIMVTNANKKRDDARTVDFDTEPYDN